MAKLNTKKPSQTHRCIVYGAPKTGKSLIAAKLAEHYNLLWIDLENGHETLFQLPEEWQERIELIDIPDSPAYPMAIETVLKMIKGNLVSICEIHGKVGCMICKRAETEAAKLAEPDEADLVHETYFTDVELNTISQDTIVVFDSLTQLTTSAINNITKTEPDDYKMKTDDWGNLAKLIEIFLSTIQQARYNCVVISHEVEAETEGKKRTLVPVAGSRNSSRNSAKAFDHVIYAERKNRKHIFSSSSTHATTILTGSRTNARLEDTSEGSLLPIFKPELYSTPSSSSVPNPSTAKPQIKTVGKQTSDVLARLKANKK